MADHKNDACPRCGYCPHCGRSNQGFYPAPIYPVPYVNPWGTWRPGRPYWGTTTVQNTSTAQQQPMQTQMLAS